MKPPKRANVKGLGRLIVSLSEEISIALPKQLVVLTKFNDYALEFYTFVADNYASYYSTPIECTERDAPYVLDGVLYNESDLNIEEHYTDTHGFMEINFAAFAMIGKKHSPRIKGVQRQRIYKIDKNKNYGS